MTPNALPANASQPKARGFTLVECVIALAVVSVGLLGLISSLLCTQVVILSNREDSIALDFGRLKIAEIQSCCDNAFTGVFAAYMAQNTPVAPTYNPATGLYEGGGGEVGEKFNVLFIDHQTGEILLSGMGYVYFPVDATGNLVENPGTGTDAYYTARLGRPVKPSIQTNLMGMPMDLNRSGAIDAATHNLDYKVLPVTVRVTWVDIKTGDPSNNYQRNVDYRTLLTALR